MKKTIFVVGSGRCGTTYLHKIFKSHYDIASYHERFPNLESFYRYTKYNNLKVDEEPLFNILKNSINKDHKEKDISFESSNLLSFHIKELYKNFKCKFIILIRNPKSVIESFIRVKNLYGLKIYKGSNNLANGYQYYEFLNKSMCPHHNFSRLVPKDDKIFKSWNTSPQKIKIMWYWNEVYKNIFKSLKKIPIKNYRVLRLEDFNYDEYKSLSRWIGTKDLKNELFLKYNKFTLKKNNKIHWTIKEKKMFNQFRSEINKKFYKFNF